MNLLNEQELPTLSDQQKDHLLSIPCVSEIKKYMFPIKINASPGPYGVTTEFFKTHWDTVGQNTVEEIQNFLRTGQLLKSWNHSILVMIPKKFV